MSVSRQEIAQIISTLDTSDGRLQREAVELLVRCGEPAIDPIVASLGLVQPRARAALISALAGLHHPSTLLPLMRFVFDRRDSLADRDARGVAMQAISALARPELADRLFDFLMERRHDADPFVRGWAIDALSRFGDPRAAPLIAEAERDAEEFVRLRARGARERLASVAATSQPSSDAMDGQHLSDEQLLQRLRASQGSERPYYMGLLKERPNAFALAASLLAEGGKGGLIGLQLMQQLDDPRARGVAARHYHAEPGATERAICLRILAQHLRADASADEIRLIEQAMFHGDEFVRMAAVAAGAASGHAPLARQALKLVERGQGMEALTAAEAISRGSSPALRPLLPELRDALHQAHQRRLGYASPEHVQTEAHMLRAINSLLDEEPLLGGHDLMQQALMSLRDAAAHWPILVSALRLLRDLIGERTLSAQARYSPASAVHLVELMTHEDERVRQRVLDLLRRGAPEGFTAMTARLERLMHDPTIDLREDIIPLLARAGGERARRLLMDMELSNDSAVAQAARDALEASAKPTSVEAKFEAKLNRPPE